jgi:glutamate/tyrosine decarboxylase-like PLP-dependent enzyme
MFFKTFPPSLDKQKDAETGKDLLETESHTTKENSPDLFKLAERAISHYLNSDDRPLNISMTEKELRAELRPSLNDDPSNLSEIETFISNCLKYSVNTSHPMFLNQLWSKIDAPSVAGEILKVTTNTSMYTYEVAPVATLLEHEVTSYLTKAIWGEPSEGIMTSGGTASNLQALLTARNSAAINAKSKGVDQNSQPLRVFAGSNSHYSIKRACNILGLGQDSVIEVGLSEKKSMDPEQLKLSIESSLQKGEKPICVVATAGSTVEGSYDPLEKIADICETYNIWLHVDGAYGASVLLSQKYASLMKGVERAQSLAWDFHKMLGINLPCAFLLMKSKGQLRSALSSGNDHYLFHEKDSLDLGPLSLQCGRPNDVLKLWLAWLSYGRVGFENRLNTLFDLSQEFAKMVDKHPQLELLQNPESINVCFRFLAPNGERIEDKIRTHLMQQGDAMVNYSSDLNGSFLRLAITRPDLNANQFQHLINLIVRTGNGICNDR